MTVVERRLMKGNEAIAEAAIQAGCDAYFGYPITPQAELLEWMARRMPEEGRAFVQAESEPIRLSARWTEEGNEQTQSWSAHRRCLAERMHESVSGTGPFFGD